MGRHKITDPALVTRAMSIRLTTAEWAEVDYAAAISGRTRNDIVRERIRKGSVLPDDPWTRSAARHDTEDVD